MLEGGGGGGRGWPQHLNRREDSPPPLSTCQSPYLTADIHDPQHLPGIWT